MSIGQPISQGLFIQNATHKADIKYGPWNDLDEFKFYINSQFWSEGLTFALRDNDRLVEYWFVGGNLEEHIEEKYKSINAIVSFWISPPVNEIVTDLPLAPTNGYRVIHNNIIKEYITDTWVDQYGGSGIALANGYAVIVIIDGVLTNQTYVWDDVESEWVNRTNGVGIDESRYVTGYIEGKRRARDFTGLNAPPSGSVRAITSTGFYVVDRDLSDLPTNTSGIAFLEVLSKDDNNLVYRYYDTTGDWIQKKEDGVYSSWTNIKGDAGDPIELRKTTTHLQWKVVTEDPSLWKDLIALSELVGPAGTPVEFRVSSFNLQWRYVGDLVWTTLIDLTSLNGEDGRNPEFRVSGGFVQWRLVGDPTWINLYSIVADSELSETSENAVQNKVVTLALQGLQTNVGNIDESKWEIGNISSGFRIPTITEWDAERLTWATNNRLGAFGSVLKLPTTGFRRFDNASISFATTGGYYWASDISFVTYSRYLFFNSSSANTTDNWQRAYGQAIRLIKEGNYTAETYVPETFNLNGLTYNTVFNSATGKVWLDRNLGATQVATVYNDTAASGWLYQWGRGTDGHQIRTSGTTSVLSSADQPGHGDFILAASSLNDWRNPQNDNLWQGVNGINSPGLFSVYRPKNNIPYLISDAKEIDAAYGDENKFLNEKGEFKEIIIPSQVKSDWEETDSNSPAFIDNKPTFDESKWEYTSIQAIKTGYGALYNWWVSQELLIDGWHTPTVNDADILLAYAGGFSLAGGKLKSTRTFPTIAPRFTGSNVGATDEFNFSLVPSGGREDNGPFHGFEVYGAFHVYEEVSSNNSQAKLFGTTVSELQNWTDLKKTGWNIRLIRNTTVTYEESLLPDGSVLGSIRDYDGNSYSIIKIGVQVWMGENLRTTHYADGTPIPNVTDNTEWSNLITGAYCWYNNDINTAGIVYTDEFIEISEGIKPKNDEKYSLLDAKEIDVVNGDESLVFTKKGTFKEVSSGPIPTDINELNDEDGLLFSGNYDDLADRPDIPPPLTSELISETLGYVPSPSEHTHNEYEPKNENIQAHIADANLHYIPVLETTPTPVAEGLEFIRANTLKKYVSYNNQGVLVWVQVTPLSKESIPVDPEWYAWFDFLWLGGIDNNELVATIGDNIAITNNDIEDEYIPVGSTATFEFDTPMDVSDLIGTDMANMPVKYDNNAPHNIRAIGVLKNTVVLTQDVVNTLSSIFELSIFWSGVFNDNGYVKANRNYEDPIEGTTVDYVNDGAITSIDPGTVSYNNDFKYFVVPTGVTEFDFLDDGKAVSFKLVSGSWIPRFDYLDSFMVHRWTFDADNNNDSVGTANSTISTNIGYIDDANPRHGRAATFNGNSKIRTTTVAAPDYSGGGYSFVCRFKPTANGASDTSYIFCKESYSSGTAMRFGFYQDSANKVYSRWLTGSGGQRNIASINSVSLNQYYTAIATWSGTFYEFFLNKELQGQSTEITTFYLDTYPFLFGSSHDGVTTGEATRKFTGEISSAYIIQKHLTQKERNYITDFGHYPTT
jgi:uncharacterized protein (TIGR02145 family)